MKTIAIVIAFLVLMTVQVILDKRLKECEKTIKSLIEMDSLQNRADLLMIKDLTKPNK